MKFPRVIAPRNRIDTYTVDAYVATEEQRQEAQNCGIGQMPDYALQVHQARLTLVPT